jgi:hypothetical protein
MIIALFKKLNSELLIVTGVILLLMSLTGCSEVDSSDLKSSGFYTSMRLTASGNNQTDVLG